MSLDWAAIDRWLMGEAWVGSQIEQHLTALCRQIGPRWSSSEGERQAVAYIRERMVEYALTDARLEDFPLDTWEHGLAEASLVESDRQIDLLPFLFCPAVDLRGPILDLGFGMPHELEAVRERLPGAVAVVNLAAEPFTEPKPLSDRLQDLRAGDAVAAVVVERKSGRRMEYHSATDWRTAGELDHPLPAVITSREDGAHLRALAASGHSLAINVSSRAYRATGTNTVADLPGAKWPDEWIVIGAHHDTVPNSPGGNDNASGTTVVLETARVLSLLQQERGIGPGCSIRFVTFGAEEQALQGSYAYVERHHSSGPLPRFALNLDELAAGPMKGVVLNFPHLRPLIQRTLDTLSDGLQCHVLAQLDASSDWFPFARRGIPSAMPWRWRFVGRHPDADFHHEPGDTADKVRPSELREYVGLLARLLLRLSHLPLAEWPADPLRVDDIEARLKEELGTVPRTM
ncbi:MAG: hypothetical protein CL878_10520 [Dehalococcoidia bacterium]|nr:hypothetical protein [Dehalococcoidia bacterium]